MKIGFIGSGNMATALINGFKDKHEIALFSPNTGKTKASDLSVGFKELKDLILWSEYIILATPIENIKEVYLKIQNAENIVSVLGGIDLKILRENLPNAKTITRALPNINVAAKLGYTALAFEGRQNISVINLFDEVGMTDIVAEKDFALVSAVAGSGPAFVDNVILKYIEAANELGLDKNISEKLTLQTFLGTVNRLETEKIYQNAKTVMTPGGSTEQGWKTLQESNLKEIFKRTFNKTIEKNNTAQ